MLKISEYRDALKLKVKQKSTQTQRGANFRLNLLGIQTEYKEALTGRC